LAYVPAARTDIRKRMHEFNRLKIVAFERRFGWSIDRSSSRRRRLARIAYWLASQGNGDSQRAMHCNVPSAATGARTP